MATKKPTPEMLGVGLGKDEIRRLIADTIITAKENFICLAGGRGIGKTYTVQKSIIEMCFLDNYEFQLVVETNDALEKGALRKWLEKVADIEFKNYEFKYTTEFVYMRREENDDWQRIGVCVPLTKATANKRNSYPKCRFIIMDEAILADGQYRAAYMDWFLTIYHTADRDENRIKAILLGNTMQKINPIFEFFDVTVPDLKKQGLVKRSFNKLFWYIPMPPDLENDPDNAFRKMIDGTKYGEMASGQFDTNYGYLIQAPPEGFQVYSDYGFYFNDKTYMQLMEADDGFLYAEVVSEEHLKKYCTEIFTTTYQRATEEYPIVPTWIIDMMKLCLENGKFKFVDEEALLVLTAKFQLYFRIYIS